MLNQFNRSIIFQQQQQTAAVFKATSVNDRPTQYLILPEKQKNYNWHFDNPDSMVPRHQRRHQRLENSGEWASSGVGAITNTLQPLHQ